jgi:hypothetical protein
MGNAQVFTAIADDGNPRLEHEKKQERDCGCQ